LPLNFQCAIKNVSSFKISFYNLKKNKKNKEIKKNIKKKLRIYNKKVNFLIFIYFFQLLYFEVSFNFNL
jgi:hypothetical protein